MKANTSHFAVNTGYTQPIEKIAYLAGQTIHYVTQPGLADWNSLTPASRLLAEHARLPSTGWALWLGCGHGAAAASLAKRNPGVHFLLLDTNLIALQTAIRTLQANHVTNAAVLEGITTLPDQQEVLDVVLIELPKGRKTAQRWLAEAWFALRPGGQLYLAGANNMGVQTTVQDANQLFGAGAILAYHKGSRILRWIKPALSNPSCDWLNSPGIAPGSAFPLQIQTPQGTLQLKSLPGVFSYDRLDEGTALLLDNLPHLAGKRICDLGCGYGVIGLLAALQGAAQVNLLDSSLLAVACAAANLERYQASNAYALTSNVFSAVPGERYDCILSNPPFHAGKGVDFQVAQAFIEQSHQALNPGGELRLVANRFLRYEKMMGIFTRVHTIAETGKYRVLSAVR